MSDFQQFNGLTHPIIRMSDDWNSLLDHGLVKGINYIIRNNAGIYEAIDGGTGNIFTSNIDAAIVINSIFSALTSGSSVFFNQGTYALTADITLIDKKNLLIYGNGATFSGGRLIIKSTVTCVNAEKNVVRGFTFSGASSGAKVMDAFMTSFEDCLFFGCAVGLEVINAVEWTEFLSIKNTLFRDCVFGLLFKTPIGTGTDSYVNSRLDHVGFTNNSNIGAYQHIKIESGAAVHEGHWTNLRFWHSFDNSMSINVLGALTRTKLFYPYFESFVGGPANLIGINLGVASESPWLSGVVFSGNWTYQIYNPWVRTLHGIGQCFGEGVNLNIGINSVYGATSTFLKTYAFSLISIPRIFLLFGGAFVPGESIRVTTTVTYVDGQTRFQHLDFALGTAAEVYFTDYQLMGLVISNNFIDHIEAKAYTNNGSTAVTVSVNAFATGL